MGRSDGGFSCQICHYWVPKWIGNCPECNTWNSFEEKSLKMAIGNQLFKSHENNRPSVINEVIIESSNRLKSGISEFDRVLGGGLVRGSLLLLGGEPGVGKSTLLAKVFQGYSKFCPDNQLLYCSGEESLSQIASRFKRLEIEAENILVLNEIVWEKIKQHIEEIRPIVLVLDSIQTTVSTSIDSAVGSVSQVREITYELMNLCKNLNISCIVIGHINKEGAIAGPKLLEHMVDVVTYFEGDDNGHYRILRSIKNRFGRINELGIFEMQEGGLCEVSNPSQYFLDPKLSGTFGRALTCINEGSRSIFFEVQSLVMESNGPSKRNCVGLDLNRLNLLAAIIEKYCSYSLSYKDIYLNIIGGKKANSREMDLAIVASLISSYCERPLKVNGGFIGEVGLTGEVRSVANIETRIKEMAQLNYTYLVTATSVVSQYKGKYPIELIGIDKVRQIEMFL